MEKSNNLPMLLGVGAIAFAALAAGLAAGPYFAANAVGPQLPPGVAAPGTGGMELPSPGPDDEPAQPQLPEGAVPLTEDERLGDLLADMIDGFGKLKRRVDALEAKSGGGSDAAGATRLDPDTGQEYRAVTVWVPEGMEEEASRFLREAVLKKLSGFDDGQFSMDTMMALQRAGGDTSADGGALGLLRRDFGPLVAQFAAAWRGREPSEIGKFRQLLFNHGVPYARAVARHNAGVQGRDARITSLTLAPAAGTDLRAGYDRMRTRIHADWQAFIAELPFDVKERYLGWCSDFLKRQ